MSEWQPIETAPKDGTWVLLTGGRVDYGWYAEQPPAVVGQWTRGLNGQTRLEGNWQFAWYDGGYYGEYETPTLWMPVSSPPREAATVSEGEEQGFGEAEGTQSP